MNIKNNGRVRVVTIPVTVSYDVYTKACKEQLDISSFLDTALHKYYGNQYKISKANSIPVNISNAYKLGIPLDTTLVDYLYELYNQMPTKEGIQREINKFKRANRLPVS